MDKRHSEITGRRQLLCAGAIGIIAIAASALGETSVATGTEIGDNTEGPLSGEICRGSKLPPRNGEASTEDQNSRMDAELEQ
jgi:hypothetical protein